MRRPNPPRAALDLSLRLARAPVDAAIDLMPGSGSGPRAAAQRVIDAVDSATRSLLGLTSEDRAVREPPADSPPRQASETRGQTARRAPAAAPRPPVAARRRPVPARRPPVPARRPPAPAPPPPAPAPAPPPTHEEIAARAFELYERGVPGDAESHWQAAERDLTAARDS